MIEKAVQKIPEPYLSVDCPKPGKLHFCRSCIVRLRGLDGKFLLQFGIVRGRHKSKRIDNHFCFFEQLQPFVPVGHPAPTPDAADTRHLCTAVSEQDSVPGREAPRPALEVFPSFGEPFRAAGPGQGPHARCRTEPQEGYSSVLAVASEARNR
ncbi:hypothetical protein [Leisingera methylohalidivorans]|uniref:hypothetical protein n=1 Tax=Leisingera methylohalidivorans TaxID=133924 RepID=UPI0018D32A9D|nr:hypothetical protein [Leisingera methylohalidivorans]